MIVVECPRRCTRRLTIGSGNTDTWRLAHRLILPIVSRLSTSVPSQ